jgi:hypothetical protein
MKTVLQTSMKGGELVGRTPFIVSPRIICTKNASDNATGQGESAKLTNLIYSVLCLPFRNIDSVDPPLLFDSHRCPPRIVFIGSTMHAFPWSVEPVSGVNNHSRLICRYIQPAINARDVNHYHRRT